MGHPLAQSRFLNQKVFALMELPDKRRLKLFGQLSRGDVLDVGCHDLQNPYLVDAIGFDLLKPKTVLPNYRQFVQGNCESINEFFPPASFDTITAGELIEHLENPSNFLRGCHQILRDDGQLLLSTPNPYPWTTFIGNLFFLRSGIEYEHINLVTFRTMVALMRNTGWDIIEVCNASGGMRLWHTTRKYFIPCPKAIAWQHLYVCKKVKRPIDIET